MKYGLAVFDLDGTLLNTLEDLAAACNYVLAQNGFPEREVQEYRYLVGNGIRSLVQHMLPPQHRDDDSVLRRLHAQFTDRYAANDRVHTRPYDGILPLLTALRESQVHVAVLSNKSHVYVPSLVEHFFPGLTELAYGQRDGVPRKPDPSALLEIIRHFGVDSTQCAYIGDSDVDMHTGRNAGVYTVGACWGFRPKKELVEAGALCTADKPEQLYQILVDNSKDLGYTAIKK